MRYITYAIFNLPNQGYTWVGLAFHPRRSLFVSQVEWIHLDSHLPTLKPTSQNPVTVTVTYAIRTSLPVRGKPISFLIRVSIQSRGRALLISMHVSDPYDFKRLHFLLGRQMNCHFESPHRILVAISRRACQRIESPPSVSWLLEHRRRSHSQAP